MPAGGQSLGIATRGQIVALGPVAVCAYLTLADVLLHKGENFVIDVTDDTDQGVANLLIVKDLAVDAQAEVDAGLSCRYTVPVASTPATTPAFVRALTRKILIFRLANRRDKLDAVVRQDYEDALLSLEKLQKGQLQVPGLSVGDASLMDSNTRANDRDPHFEETRYDRDGNDVDENRGGARSLNVW